MTFSQSELKGRILFEGTSFYATMAGGEAISALKAAKAAKAAKSSEAVLNAQKIQTLSGYSPDDFTMVTLKKGDVILGGKPGQSQFYTDLDSVLQSNLSRSDLFQGLQSAPHSELGYRPRLGSYTVTEDISVSAGRTLANPQYGSGGYKQYVIEDFNNFLRYNGGYNLGK